MSDAHLAALTLATSALSLIATPRRPDGSYNRDRSACEALAQETLNKINALLSPAAVSAAVASQVAVPAALPAKGLTVYTDGGCKGNPGPAGWGVVIAGNGTVLREACGYIGHQTNQIAELEAAIQGLMLTPDGAEVELVSDSQYMLKGLTEWSRGWERNGFRNASNQPVANLSYWKRLYALADARQVTTRWVRGHNGDPFNERCDALASAAIANRGA